MKRETSTKKKAMEGDSNINCHWCTWNKSQRFGKRVIICLLHIDSIIKSSTMVWNMGVQSQVVSCQKMVLDASLFKTRYKVLINS